MPPRWLLLGSSQTRTQRDVDSLFIVEFEVNDTCRRSSWVWGVRVALTCAHWLINGQQVCSLTLPPRPIKLHSSDVGQKTKRRNAPCGADCSQIIFIMKVKHFLFKTVVIMNANYCIQIILFITKVKHFLILRLLWISISMYCCIAQMLNTLNYDIKDLEWFNRNTFKV